MSKPYILAIGDIVTDAFIELDERYAKSTVDEQGNPWLSVPLGTKPPYKNVDVVEAVGNSANAAVAFSRLGLGAELMAYIGDDQAGTDMLNYLKRESVTTAAISVSQNKKSNYHYVLRYGAERTILIKYEDYEYVWQTPSRTPDWIYLSMLSEKSWPLHEELLSYLEHNPQVKLVFQPGTFHFEWGVEKLAAFYQRAHLVFMNVEEAMLVTGIKSHDIEELANGLHSLGVAIAVITDGPNGAYASDQRRIVHIPNYPDPQEPIDRTGAGDAFASTVTAAIATGEDIETALRWAAINSMNVCQQIGAQAGLLTQADIGALLIEAPDDFTPKTIAGQKELTMEEVAKKLVEHPKGIFAADQSGGNIEKMFQSYNIASTEETRRQYRQIFFTTPEIENYTSGIILFDETARQADDNGTSFIELITQRGMLPGIKVDRGLIPLPGFDGETVTSGLDGLGERLAEYRRMGLRFAKWRAALTIRGTAIPSDAAIAANVHVLARYALECQNNDIVPIVEPEIVHHGDFDLATCKTVTAKVLDALFDELALMGVRRTTTILKTSMVLAGDAQADTEAHIVGAATVDTLVHHVPHDIAGIVFLSGGQTPEQATSNLQAINQQGKQVWPLTFSFARALQLPVLDRWRGEPTNVHEAQTAFLTRLQANSAALGSQDVNSHHIPATPVND